MEKDLKGGSLRAPRAGKEQEPLVRREKLTPI